MKKQILAIGGNAIPPELDNLLLVEHFLSLTGRKKPRVCFIGAAHGDADAGRLRFYAGFSQFSCVPTHLPLFARTPRDLASFVMEQDAIYVGGGNTRSMLAVWREWQLDQHLRAAYDRGVVMGGASAGSICWFEQGMTDSVAVALTAMPCLGILKGSNCPHYNSEPLRRPTYRRFVASGKIIDGLAADDGVGLYFVDGRFKQAVSNHPRARAWRVTRQGRRFVEKALPTRYLGKR